MKRYVLGIVLDYNLEYALLIHRNKNPYAGCLNGIGGKIEDKENMWDAMFRELTEETNYTVINSKLHAINHLMTIRYPSNIELNVIYIILDGDKADCIITDEGTVSWCSIEKAGLLDVTNKNLAGEGNLSYFVNYAILSEKWRRENA